MSDADVQTHAFALLIKISVITGWHIPDDKEYQSILVDQFSKKIVENYGSLNVQEVEYAIRNNGTQIKDWGKSINLSLVDEALQPYLLKRSEIRKLEESAIKPKELPAPTEPVNYEEMIETVRKIYLKTGKVGLIPTPVYDILEETINLTLEEKNTIKAQVEKRLMAEAETEGLRAVVELKHFQKSNPKDYAARVRNECKKQAVANWFWKENEIDKF